MIANQSDAYADTVRQLQERKDTTISVPELSRLLGVKPTTLNAKLRRQHVEIQTIGRTNLVPGSLALRLAETHRHALSGWPTLREASQIIGVKAGTIKAWCEKGQVESSLDLTKRLRINPAELDRIHEQARIARPEENEPRSGRVTIAPGRPPTGQQAVLISKKNGVVAKIKRGGDGSSPSLPPQAHEGGDEPSQRRVPSAQDRVPHRDQGKSSTPHSSTPATAVAPRKETNGGQTNGAPAVMRPVPSNLGVRLISARDYGLPLVETVLPPSIAQPKSRRKGPAFLSYDPDFPFSIAVCAVGKVVTYDGYEGKIVELVDDPFSPKIKVRFPEHRHPLMREILLTVGKRGCVS